MAIFVTFKTKDTMKSFFILLSLYYFLVVNVVSADSVTFPSRVEIVMDEDLIYRVVRGMLIVLFLQLLLF